MKKCLSRGLSGLLLAGLIVGGLPAHSALAAAPAATAAPAPLTRVQMEADLRQLAQVTKDAWAYVKDKPQVNIDGLLTAALARLDQTKTRLAFEDLMREFVAGLHDGHAYIYTPDLNLHPTYLWPIKLSDTSDGLLVSWLDRSLGKQPVLAVGDKLISVDGQPIDTLLATEEKLTVASTDGARRYYALQNIRRTFEPRPLSFSLERPDGSRYQARLAPLSFVSEHDANLALKPFEWRRLQPDVGYLKIRTFEPEREKWKQAHTTPEREKVLKQAKATLAKAFAELDSAHSLILDLRGNGGGTDLLGIYVAQHLIKGSFTYCSRQARISAEALALPDWAVLKKYYQPGSWSNTSARQIPADKHIRAYAGKVVVLMDEGSFSATDKLLACLADLLPNVVFIGRPSGGGTGSPREIATLTHSKAVLTFCTMRIWSPNGRQIEGRGTQPTLAVRPSRADLLAGRDAELAAALNQATGQTKPNAGTDLNKEGKG